MKNKGINNKKVTGVNIALFSSLYTPHFTLHTLFAQRTIDIVFIEQYIRSIYEL